jgi:hypothetical protein
MQAIAVLARGNRQISGPAELGTWEVVGKRDLELRWTHGAPERASVIATDHDTAALMVEDARDHELVPLDRCTD